MWLWLFLTGGGLPQLIERIVKVPEERIIEVPVEKLVERIVRVPEVQRIEAPTHNPPTHPPTLPAHRLTTRQLTQESSCATRTHT